MADDNVEIATKHCPACKQDIPVANFDMHTVHCQRFLTTCPQCGDSVNKAQLQEHIDENHAEVKCDVCGDKLEKMELDDHKASSCKKRNVNCKFCEIILPACDISEHQESCGSRTEECENCQRRILVKDFENHIASGCKTPVKTNAKTGLNNRNQQMPTRLIGSNNERSVPRGFGFPFHPQFQPYNPLAKDEGVDPSSGYKTYDYLNNDAPRNSRPIRHMIQNRFTPESPLNTFSTSQERRSENSFKDSSVGVESKRSEKRMPVFRNERRFEERKVEELPQRSRSGISSSDSDSSDDTMAEDKKPFPDLTDETLLPCEFCNEMFPADSLGFHQANCDNVPTTPRPFSPPKMKRLSLDRFPGKATSFQPYENGATALPPDIGEGSAPCEFCSESFPLINVALHQVTCKKNPNLHVSNTSETHDRTSPEPKSRFVHKDSHNSFDSPKSHMSQKSNDSESLKSIVPPSHTKPKASMSSSPNIQAREKRALAPNFSVPKAPKTVEEVTTPSEPKTKPNFNKTTSERSDLERKPQHNKRKNKRIPKKNHTPQTFHEVNKLGGDKQTNEWPSNPRDLTRNPFGTDLPPFINNEQHRGSHFGISGGQRNPRSSRSIGSNTRRTNQRAGGANSARVQYLNRGNYNTRGRSRGSNTVTYQQRRANNPRQVNGMDSEERDVSSQPDFSLWGRSPSYGHQRGSGQRLGSGNSSSSRGQSRLLPPTTNNYD